MLEHEAPYVMAAIEAKNRPANRSAWLIIVPLILALGLCGTIAWVAANPPHPTPAGESVR